MTSQRRPGCSFAQPRLLADIGAGGAKTPTHPPVPIMKTLRTSHFLPLVFVALTTGLALYGAPGTSSGNGALAATPSSGGHASGQGGGTSAAAPAASHGSTGNAALSGTPSSGVAHGSPAMGGGSHGNPALMATPSIGG